MGCKGSQVRFLSPRPKNSIGLVPVYFLDFGCGREPATRRVVCKVGENKYLRSLSLTSGKGPAATFAVGITFLSPRPKKSIGLMPVYFFGLWVQKSTRGAQVHLRRWQKQASVRFEPYKPKASIGYKYQSHILCLHESEKSY